MRFPGIKSILSAILLILFLQPNISAQADNVKIIKNSRGYKLQVNGKDFFIKGMNWDYFPIGENYVYSLWNQPDDFIKKALDREMKMLKNLGVNVIRVYDGIQPKWIEYIYENYGIYTAINHSFGRYGLTIDGAYISNTEYSDPSTQQVLLQEVKRFAEKYRNTKGLLLWILGNENNYGLFWDSAETSETPTGESVQATRARHMYKMFNKGVKELKKLDKDHPVAICNGDLLFIDILAKEVTDMDLLAINSYRGVSFTDLFNVANKKLNVPIMFTEFGSDAYNAIEQKEDQLMQSKYIVGNWKEIYLNAYDYGAANCLGGMTFQFSDGWWKYKQETNLDIHDTHASWSNGGYSEDFREDFDNMNEEWFGICAKGPTDNNGFYELYPRAAYYVLKEIHQIDPLDENLSNELISKYFDNISTVKNYLKARRDKAALKAENLSPVRISGLRLEFNSFSTGGDKVTTPDDKPSVITSYPAFKGFDHLESFYAEVESKPSENVTAKVAVNVLGNVPVNPIDEIFYENRGRSKTVKTTDGQTVLSDIERVKVYRASLSWDDEYFTLDGFYRTGHYHWGYEGDFFGLYPEANYGQNIDIYNGSAPSGFEFTGKKALEGLKIAFGPELWWGANPAVLIKYRRAFGPFTVTGIYHEDLDKQGEAVSSFAVPQPKNRRATLAFESKIGDFGFEIGGIWSGNTKLGWNFQVADKSNGKYRILQDKIKGKDQFGGKAKITYSRGKFNWYAEGSVQGLVADGGVNQSLTFTGWRLKNSGIGNSYSFLTGMTYLVGDLQIAPNFLWQKPIEGPIPSDVPAPGRPRNILDDPFAVLGNRETVAAELLFTYDPTPATWMYAWDSDVREDAKLAFSAGVVFRHQPTTRDASIGILADGRTIFAFPGAPSARDLWEFHCRLVSKLSPKVGMIANLYAGEGESNGSDQRSIHRYGANIQFAMNSLRLITIAKVNDWGPYDYHRDFNLTYPLQLIADLSYQLDKPKWFDLPSTRLGIRTTWRSLDKYSPRFSPANYLNVLGESLPDPNLPGASNGSEWEIRTYLHFNFGM